MYKLSTQKHHRILWQFCHFLPISVTIYGVTLYGHLAIKSHSSNYLLAFLVFLVLTSDVHCTWNSRLTPWPTKQTLSTQSSNFSSQRLLPNAKSKECTLLENEITLSSERVRWKNKKEMSFKTFGDNDSKEHLGMFLKHLLSQKFSESQRIPKLSSATLPW